ncbi:MULTISPECIES: ABC transporter substrate-binding protein [unclassified Streptomyces]|uniref:ABC transporter substrate-binding protein n=1 Tax=unclassified Streptomyces TaxID=2593676 RepID=UPI00224DB92E|nr:MULTISPECIES: ABC transporter substrate-binding protein [unclassified Streptomyces]WSP57641.1 ABC transporter substrate-binding protein [Streptomyces sp. NBC_01241]WSU21628.1 ABC transporter substrate-binding protein [Streptomyces sp. NBC_01108]MCX4789511.1 ABC transporter substrate-binding protein [Streptomyces sp. NBC_01221]MCX4794768.1 ABC transporter substrate-binding protein [Streptomyces sp. NBC_01242]WSJ36088.1 ABC transporter substrate-binding protein [Streptomyces sp. NBC_01321]
MRSLRMSVVPALAAVMLASLTACDSSAAGGGDSTTHTTDSKGSRVYGKCTATGSRGSIHLKTVEKDTLTVVGDLPSPGWWNGDTVRQIADGYEYCMAANLAYRAGLSKLTVRNVSFDALVAGKAQDFDMALAEISITDARRKVVDFSAPYFASNIGVLVTSGSKVTEENISGMRLGVKQGTTGADFVRDRLRPKDRPKVFAGDVELQAALQAGQIDAALTDVAIVLGKAQESKGKLQVIGQYNTGESYGALYPKGSKNSSALDGAIEAMKKDGTLDKLSSVHLAKAFGGDPSVIPTWSAK